MGKLVMSMVDFDNEVSTAGFPASDLTLANIDTEYAAALALRNAVNAISLGLETSYSITAKTSPQAVGKASSEQAQRESKMLVQYYDSVTFTRATVTIPCADLTLLQNNGEFYRNDGGTYDAAIETFVTAFEAYVPGPGGNASVVDAILHVGRNL